MTDTRRCVLITGCSSGIGLDAARTLAARGWRVFASARREEDCARLRAEGFASPRIDHEDEESIAAGLGEVIEATGGRLDALFNNGAYALPGAVEDIPRAGLRAIFEANLFGVHDLTCRVIPVMRRQGHGRIVNCSSVLGFSALKWRGAYVATKHALEGLTDSLRMEMADTPIRVILIEPGPVRTAFRRNARVQFERWIDWRASARADLYERRLLPRLYDESGKPDRFELAPEAVSAKLVHALESPRPRPRYFVTTPTYVVEAMRRLLPTRLRDRVMARNS